jgi:pimeloyl-ACP methyl ester carboxylesterase
MRRTISAHGTGLGHAGLDSDPIARRMCRALFRAVIPYRRRFVPAGAEPLSARARDGVRLHGWCLVPPAPRATVIIIHGLLRSSALDGIPAWCRHFREAHGVAAAALDLRGHGGSGDGVPSFGLAESWDIRAFVAACAARGLPAPYVLVGASLGAWGAQLAARDDARIAGALLVAMPGWPRQAFRVGAKRVAVFARDQLKQRHGPWLTAILGPLVAALGRVAPLLGRAVNRAYGRDMLGAADLRAAPAAPAHRPRILLVVGDRDVFDWRAGMRAWRAWYPDRPGRPGAWPAAAADQDAWFVLARGLNHPPEEPHPGTWPPMGELVRQFLAAILDD